MKFKIAATTLFSLILSYSPFDAFSQEYIVEKLGADINTNYDEQSPVLTHDGKTMFFTRVGSPDFNKTLILESKDCSSTMATNEYFSLLKDIFSKISSKPIANAVSSSFNQDIWIAEYDNGAFSHISHPDSPANNALPNSICSLTPEENKFIVINQFPKEGGMDAGFSIIERKNETEWSEPSPIFVEDYYTRQAGVSLTMSSDGKVLILSLDRKDGLGNTDLYFSEKKDDDTWTSPINLGESVNSSSRETTPYLSADMKRLFFSSNREGTKGGNDIFMIERLDDTWLNWSSPRAFIAPINSVSDDSQPYFDIATGYLYFTSKRDGSSDIFRVKIAPAIPQDIIIAGRAINSKDNRPIETEVFCSYNNGRDVQKVVTAKDGTFSVKIPRGAEVVLNSKKRGYISHTTFLIVDKSRYASKPLEALLILDPIETNAMISLKPIYFKQSEATILEKSYPELEDLFKIMTENKEISILIEGHTDNQGNALSLLELSEKRALALKKYLVDKGIDTNRIKTTGYGGDKPITTNNNDEQRKKNRRVEIKIIKTGRDSAVKS